MCIGQRSIKAIQDWIQSADGSRFCCSLCARLRDCTGCTEFALCLAALLSLHRLSPSPDPNREYQTREHPLADLHYYLVSGYSIGIRQGTLENIAWSFCRVVPFLGVGETAGILRMVSYAVDTKRLPPSMNGILDHYIWIRFRSFLNHEGGLNLLLRDLSTMCSLMESAGGRRWSDQCSCSPKLVSESSVTSLASQLSSWGVVEAEDSEN